MDGSLLEIESEPEDEHEEEKEEENEISTAARTGDEEAVIRLLDADPGLLDAEPGPVNMDTGRREGNPGGHRPLRRAAFHGQLGVVKLVVQRGANINATGGGSGGGTALDCAAQNGHEAVVAFLLSNGAQADRRDGGGSTPLMCASMSGHLGVVQMLLQYSGGQGLDDWDKLGMTALHSAAFWGRDQVVRCLLLAGADPTVTKYQEEGTTPRALVEEARPDWMPRECGAGRARCVAVFEWWEGELERRYVLSRATSLHKAYTTQRDQPTSRLPTYLEARVAAGHAVPGVEVVSPQSQGEEEQQQEEGEEERHAVVEFVLKGLNEELLTELLEGFHSAK